MNKLLTKIVGVVLGTTMAVGVGVGVAVNNRDVVDSQVNAANTTETINYNDEDVSGIGASGGGTGDTVTRDPIQVVFTSVNGNTSYVQVYGNSKITISKSGTTSVTIKKVVMTGTSSTYIRSWKADTSTVSVSSSTATWDYSTGVASLELTNNSGSQARITKFEITYEASGAPTPSSYSVTYNGNGATSGDVPVDENSPYAANSDVTVLGKGNLAKDYCTFTGWNTAANGTGTSYAAGSTIEDISANTTLYAQWSFNPTHSGDTQGDAYVVAEAKAAIDLGTAAQKEDKYVTGIVAAVPYPYTEANGVTYDISDDGTTTSILKAYKGVGSTSYPVDSADDVLVGDIVVVKGNLTIYNSTYELAQGNELISLVRKYSVTYDDNGASSGTVPTDNNKYLPSETVTVLGNTGNLAKENATFIGWNTDSSATTAQYVANNTFSMGSANVTLYAIWQEPDSITRKAESFTLYRGEDLDLTTCVTTTGTGALSFSIPDGTTVATLDGTTLTGSSSSSGDVVVTACKGSASTTFTVNVRKAPTWDYITDTLTNADFDAEGTTYVTTTNISKVSNARYTANTAKANSQFRIRDIGNSSGIISTTSGGYINQITAVNVQSSRTITVYGKNTAYSSISELNNESTRGTVLGTITSSSLTLTVTGDYEYFGLYSSGATTITSISFKWKVEGAEKPLESNPVLSPSGSANVTVGKDLALTVTTNPVDSDELLTITSANTNYVTVSGSGRSFVIHGVAETASPVSVTVAGVKGDYSSSISISVIPAQKTYEDKILTVTSLGISAYDTDTTNTYTDDGVGYTCYNVMNSSGIQFRKDTPAAGYIANKEVLYNGANNAIKSITLVMSSNNSGSITIYEGTEANPSTDTASLVDGSTWQAKGVNTFVFDSGMTYFKILASGTTNVSQIIVELVDNADSVLTKARSAASAILTGLSGLCGDNGSGNVTQSQWDSINSSLTALNLTDDDKLFLKNAHRIMLGNLAQGGATIENALAHYDYCVQKFGYTDVLGIANVASANPSLNNGVVNNATITSVVVIISVISLSTLCGYFLLRKRKEQ